MTTIMKARVNVLVHTTVKQFAKMTIQEAMDEIFRTEESLKSCQREIRRMASSGTIARGVTVDSTEKVEYVQAIYDKMDTLEKNYTLLTSARNHTNDNVRIEIDDQQITLTQALAKQSSYRRQMDRFKLFPPTRAGAKPFYDSRRLNNDYYRKDEYVTRLNDTIHRANNNIILILPD